VAVTEKPNRSVYQLKAVIQEIQPPIWRRFQVRGDITLPQLHQVLQVLFGWEDYHLHEFTVAGRPYTVPDGEPDWDTRKGVDERGVRLNSVVMRVGTRFGYAYDFGDNWQVDLLLEAILLGEEGAQYPGCIGGERRGPPEDVGGVFGCQEYLAALANRRHPQHRQMLQWRGAFDPENFDQAGLNRELARRFRQKMKRKKLPSLHTR
jgi:hypothetical protein